MESGRENVHKAIELLEKEWGIPRIISPDDLHEAPDDKSVQL